MAEEEIKRKTRKAPTGKRKTENEETKVKTTTQKKNVAKNEDEEKFKKVNNPKKTVEKSNREGKKIEENKRTETEAKKVSREKKLEEVLEKTRGTIKETDKLVKQTRAKKTTTKKTESKTKDTKIEKSSNTKKNTESTRKTKKNNDEKIPKNPKKQAKKDDERIKKILSEQINNIEKIKNIEEDSNKKIDSRKNKYNPQEIADKIENKIKLTKDAKNKIYNKIGANILVACAITIYLIFLNLGCKNINSEAFITDLRVFSVAFIGITILIFENAYNMDNGTLAMFGVESLIVSILTLISVYVYILYKETYMILIAIASLIIVFYYICKSVVVAICEKRKYKNTISDVKEIVDE